MRRAIIWMMLLGVCLTYPCRAGTLPEDGNVQDLRAILQGAKEKVFPAVVFITAISERYEGGKKEKAQSAGSGVIISADGKCVTNWHVVDRAVTLRCLLFDGAVGDAEIIGTDKDTDLALLQLKISGRTEFPSAELADSDRLTEGQFVMAMGAPWGLSRSVSLGILSCTSRFLPNAEYNLWLQTDASINPGNSGGPLVDTNGRVIGINTLGSMYGGNLAFAIPANVVKETTRDLQAHGRVPRAWTGVRLQPLKDFERNTFYEAETGVLVASVDAGSPAEKAGLKIRDLILKVGDAVVSGVNREDLPRINLRFAALPTEEMTPLLVRRDGKELTLELTPRKKGSVEGDDFDCRDWNMTVKGINEFEVPMLHFFRSTGVYIQGVKYPGNASRSGLTRGDILVSIDETPVSTLEELQAIYTRLIEDPAREKKVKVAVLRAGLTYQLILDYATKYGQD